MRKDSSKITVLLYHEVTDFPERAKKIRKMGPADCLMVRQFEEQMALLSQGPNMSVVTADDILNQAEEGDKRIVLTFDDGFIGNYLFAFDVLERYGFKATFFVTVDDISKERYMSWDQLGTLDRHGHSIQSHTMTHPMLGECDQRRITYELEASKKIIEDKIRSPVRYLSLPYGSLNERVIKIAEDTGYKAIFTSTINSKHSGSTLHRFGRIHVKDTCPLKKFVRLIDPNPTQFFLNRTGEALRGMIKRIIGLNNYRKLYRFMYRIEI